MNDVSTKTIKVGKQKDTDYTAFGDDSQIGDMLVYAFIVVNNEAIPHLEEKIYAIKKHYCFPPETHLHCKVLFNHHARKKAGLDHLTPEQAKSILRRVVHLFIQTPIFLRYGYCDFAKFKSHFDQFGNELELYDKDGNVSGKTQFIADSPKGILGTLAQMSLNAKPKDILIPPVDKCKVVVSADKTKVHFLGENRRQAHYWSRGYSAIDTPKGSVFQLDPIIMNANESPMLEIADIAAYLCCQALQSNNGTQFFNEQLKRIKHWASAKLVIDYLV